jgi:CubicO group peptidase (beta-lactamase class C family)
MDEKRLSQAVERIRSGIYQNVHSLVIVKDGKLVFEEYFPGYDFKYEDEQLRGDYVQHDADTRHNLASVTKSFTSALVGIAIDQGSIPGVEAGLYTFYPEHAGLSDAQKEKITLEDLLTMRGGFEWNEEDVPYSDPRNDLIMLFRVSDPVKYILSKPMSSEPGSTFYYSGGCTNLLGDIIRRTTGLRMDAYAEKHLFEPLGITSFQWDFINPDFVHASGNLYLRPRDLAKFGLLYLQGGLWDGKRILSEAWVQASTAEQVKLSTFDGYGYQWWRKTYPMGDGEVQSFFAAGWGGQYIKVFPELEMVVVFTGGNYASPDPVDAIISDYILPAVR